MEPAIFLDRDGVIIENRVDYILDWSQVTILPPALEALCKIRDTAYRIIIVTNQSPIGRGLMSFEKAEEINLRLVKAIVEYGGRIDGVFMCPHAPEDHCNCRKPQPGLFFQAAQELSLDLSHSWIVGDAWSDLLAGQAAGLNGLVLVKTGRGIEQLLLPRPFGLNSFLLSDNLDDALTTILMHNDALT